LCSTSFCLAQSDGSPLSTIIKHKSEKVIL
jgi:hypothetical protein